MFNPHDLKKDFPVLTRKINGKLIAYLDNASTSQKPQIVINSLSNYYSNYNANIHRGIHFLAEEATQKYENTRKSVAKFIKAKSTKEIIFTRNTTESINLVAYTWGEKNIEKDDEIIVSAFEHHSNLVPWQELAKRKNARLKTVPITKDFLFDESAFDRLLSKKTRLIAISAMSNLLGTIPPLDSIIQKARQIGAKILVDGAQAAAHMPINVQKMDCDFFTFSAHKCLGPTGVGILYGKEEILNEMPPFLFGGEMIKEVQTHTSTYNELPWKFEAGTPNIADVIAFDESIKYLEKIGMDNILNHSRNLTAYAYKKFSDFPKIKLFCPPPEKKRALGSILSFALDNVHAHDIASILNEEGVLIRSGQHCAQPLTSLLQVPSTARMSFYFYNTTEDIDRAHEAMKKVFGIFKI